MANEKIKGIMHLDAESELFEEKVKKIIEKGEESLGIKLSMEWELDKITLHLTDKNEGLIASLVFDNTDFQSIVESIMPPTTKEIQQEKEPTKEEKKQIEKDIKEYAEYMQKHPTKKEIDEYHQGGK